MKEKKPMAEIQTALKNHFVRHLGDPDVINWSYRLKQKKDLKHYLLRFGGELLPGRLISMEYDQYMDLKKYCPEALILIDDLNYTVQLRLQSKLNFE
jgi:hypothetical protein